VSLRRAANPGAQPERPADARGQTLVTAAADAFFAAAGRTPFGFTYRIEGDVPPARGLGSSVTVLGGVLVGLDALAGANLGRPRLVELATALEGHPDNASAGLLGGFCVARCDPHTDRYLDVVRLDVAPELRCVVASPAVEIVTKESRGALPDTLPYFDAVKSINSATYLVAAFATRDYAKLRHAAGDYMHEPYRLPRIPGGGAAIAAGIAAGAFTGWLSGSGSSVLCLATDVAAPAVGAAMRDAFAAAHVACEVRALATDHAGAVVM
jgi:homoserine kinase